MEKGSKFAALFEKMSDDERLTFQFIVTQLAELGKIVDGVIQRHGDIYVDKMIELNSKAIASVKNFTEFLNLDVAAENRTDEGLSLERALMTKRLLDMLGTEKNTPMELAAIYYSLGVARGVFLHLSDTEIAIEQLRTVMHKAQCSKDRKDHPRPCDATQELIRDVQNKAKDLYGKNPDRFSNPNRITTYLMKNHDMLKRSDFTHNTVYAWISKVVPRKSRV